MGTVSEQFIELCDRHGLKNKAAIALMIGRTRQHIAAIFRGSVEASEDTLRRLEDSIQGREPLDDQLQQLKESLSKLPEERRLFLVKRTIQKAEELLNSLEEKESNHPSP